MKYFWVIILIGTNCIVCSAFAQQSKLMKKISLPVPELKGKVSVEQAIYQRRSRRQYQARDLSLEQIGQLLWSAQGITDPKRGFRAAPSAGAIYPIEIYLAKQDGLFHYLPQTHQLKRLSEKDLRGGLAKGAWGQSFIAEAPVAIVITAGYERIISRYGQRGRRYTDIEVGHIAQNVHLQAVSLGLDSVPVGAFDDKAIKKLMQLPENEEPLYIIPIGYSK